jgi:translocation and assembly module TamB
VDFFSDADLSQSDILSYIVLGRPMYQNGQLNVLCSQTVANNKTTTAASTAAAASSGCAQSTTSTGDLALATAAIKLGSSSGGEGLAGRIGGVFGIQDVAVGAESTTDDTQFTVSGYINPKLYLSYGVGVFTPVNTVKIRYNITPRLYLEGVSSLENAIDIYYNFKF